MRALWRALERSPAASLTLGVLLVLLAVLPPGNYSVDGNSMVAVSESLLQGRLTVPCDLGAPGRGGACYSTWYPLLSVVSVPFVIVGRAVGELASLPPHYSGRVVALIVPALSLAGAAGLTVKLARELGASRKAAVGAGIALAFATEALTYGRTGYAETLGAFFVALAAWGLAGNGRRHRLGMAAVTLAVLTKPQLVVVGPAIGFAYAWGRRSWRPLIEASVPAGVGGLAFLGYNWLRFESPLDFGGYNGALEVTGYEPSNFAESVALLLISPGRGFFVFSPVLILAVWALWKHRRLDLAAAALAVTVAMLLFYASKPGIVEGWGTRYLVPALPLLCAGLGVLKRSQLPLAVVLTLVGLVINVPTLLAPYERINAERVVQGAPPQEYWTPTKSAAVEQWPAALRQVREASRSDPQGLVDQAGLSQTNAIEGQALLRVVFQWWWMLPVAGLPHALGLAAALLLVALGAGLVALAAGVGRRRRLLLPRADFGLSGYAEGRADR